MIFFFHPRCVGIASIENHSFGGEKEPMTMISARFDMEAGDKEDKQELQETDCKKENHSHGTEKRLVTMIFFFHPRCDGIVSIENHSFGGEKEPMTMISARFDMEAGDEEDK